MNKIILSLLSAIVCLPALCQQRSDAAMLRAAQRQWSSLCHSAVGLPREASLQVLKRTDALTVYGTPGQGFVVTARSMDFPAVVAYSDSRFPQENVPDGLQWWMDKMERVMDSGFYSSAAALSSDTYSPVEPMLKTNWAQESPYNGLCPTTGGAWGSKPMTGCVATAMAQILNFFQYPSSSTGDAYYLFDGSDTHHNVSLSTTFDWANMANTYTWGYSDAQAKAVQELMRDCGYASHTVYSAQGSGTTAYDAGYGLAHNMRYDSLALRVSRRIFFGDDDWMTAIYDELQARRPILYNAVDPDKMGHAFVFDGMDSEGRVHINWGWSGTANGYFDVRSLNGLIPSYPNPYTGGTIAYNFCEDQIMVTGFKPQETPDAGEHYRSYFAMLEPDSMWIDNDSLKLKPVPMFNFTHLDFTGLLGIVVEDTTGHAVVQPFFYTPWQGADGTIGLLGGSYPTTAFYPAATLNDADGTTPRPDGRYKIYLVSWSSQEMAGHHDPQHVRFPVAFAKPGQPNYNVWEVSKENGHWVESSMRLSDPTVADAISTPRLLPADGKVRVYDMQGRLIFEGDRLPESLGSHHGVVIVRQNGRSYKIKAGSVN